MGERRLASAPVDESAGVVYCPDRGRDRRISYVGVILSERDRDWLFKTAKIFAPQAGTIKQVFVEEGEPVKEGQPLLALETKSDCRRAESAFAPVSNLRL
jgi:multidrug efflux pump subunit AcrA (membrane-fusion protein)